jgi:membrane protein DedA with SNARE-associated domain
MFSFFGLIAPYTEFIAHFAASQVVLAPLLLLFIEESGIPLLVPGDVILAYVGYNVSTTPGASLVLATIVAMIAVTLGSSILFFAARKWGNSIVNKVGKFLFIEQSDLKRAENLFKKYGMWTILIGRHIPGMRIPLTIFAGISGMSYRTFISATLASTVLWIALFLNVGHRYGKDFAKIVHHSVTTSILIVISILVVILGMHFWGRWRKRHKNKS